MKRIRKQYADFARKVVELKAEAGKLRLWRTMHALETPVQVVGYEIADIIEEKQKA